MLTTFTLLAALTYSQLGQAPSDTPAPAPAPAATVQEAEREAGKSEEPKASGDEAWRLFPEEVGGFTIRGLVYGTGLGSFTNGGGTRYNGPLTMNDQNGVYLNQLWLTISKGLKEDELGVGFTTDIFWGNDFNASQSRGWENQRAIGWVPRWNDNMDYGIAIPQLFAEFGTTKYNVRVGHFWTPIGYQVVKADGNFFNTQPYGFMMTNPFTHWGALGNAQVTDNLMVTAAIVNGWDALDRPANVASYLAGFKYSFNEEKGFFSSYGITGVEPQNLGTGYGSRTLVCNIFDYKFSDKFEYVLENNLGWQRNTGAEDSMFYNFANYFFYQVSCNVKAGLRYEWFHDPTGFISSIRQGNQNNGPILANNVSGPYHGNMQSISAGINWSPNGSKNLMVRPELRYDWFNGTGVPFNLGKDDSQLFFVLGAYYLF